MINDGSKYNFFEYVNGMIYLILLGDQIVCLINVFVLPKLEKIINIYEYQDCFDEEEVEWNNKRYIK